MINANYAFQADQGGFTSFPDPEPQSNKDTERILGKH